jgi:6,7-dimethyl-8-ribityllumazine synthase
VNTYETSQDATQLRFGVVVARFYDEIADQLLGGCTDELIRCGASPDDIDVAWVPGAFEIPMAVRAMAVSGRYHAVVTLGAVIRGETPHFDYVCRGVTDGLREIMRDTSVPVAFGVLTTHDSAQAFARCGGDHGHKGEECARVAIEMARLMKSMEGPAGNRQ